MTWTYNGVMTIFTGYRFAISALILTASMAAPWTSASVALMERSEIRGGIDASRQSRITLRSIRATHLKDRAKIAFCESFPRFVINFRFWAHRASTPLRSDVSRQQSRCFNDLEGHRV